MVQSVLEIHHKIFWLSLTLAQAICGFQVVNAKLQTSLAVNKYFLVLNSKILFYHEIL